MKKAGGQHLGSLIFFLALLGATLYLLLRDGEAERLLPALRAASPLPLLAGLGAMVLFVCCEAFGILVLLRSFSFRPSFLQCLKYSFIGFYFCSITPSASGGQPAQVYYMRRDGLETGPSALSILVITASYQAGILLIGLVMFAQRRELIAQQLGPVRYFVLYGIAVNLILVVLLACAAFRADLLKRILSSCIRLLGRLKWIKDPEKLTDGACRQLAEYEKGAAYIRRHPCILLWVLSAILLQILCRLSVAYAVYRAFGLQGYSWLDIAALQAMLALAVESLPLPGAVGAAEAGFLTVNRAIFGASRLVPAMLASRGISFYAIVLLSAGVVLAAQLKGRGGQARSGESADGGPGGGA